MNTEAIRNKIELMNEEIDSYQKKIERMPREVGDRLDQVINDVNKKKSILESKIKTYKNATDSAYDDIQSGVEMAWDDLKMAYDSAKERFKEEFNKSA